MRLMVWIGLGLIGVAVVGALLLLGVARALWSFIGAGLVLGATGYAVQGRPGMPGHPVRAFTRPIALDQDVIELRSDMFGRSADETSYVTLADAATRAGDPQTAVRAMLRGVDDAPHSAALWTWLGMAYERHDGGVVSPAARFAFRQAIRLEPGHPGPPFFFGVALIQSGDFAAARPYWARALALSPKDVPYRPAIAERLGVLDEYLAMTKTSAADRH